MIVTIAKVADFDQFLKTFRRRALRRGSSTGPRAPTSSAIPDDPSRVWVFFDWQIEDYERFLSDPDIPAIARELAVREPPVKADPVAQYDS